MTLPATAAADVTSTVTVSGVQPDTTASFAGYASPDAFVTITDGAAVVGTVSANASGVFSKTLTNQTPGNHNFGLTATDTHGDATPVISFALNLQDHADTTVTNILLPVTLTTQTGVRPTLLGTGTPGNTLTLFIDSGSLTESTTVTATGAWSRTLTTQLTPGNHTAYVVASGPSGLISAPSQTVSFTVTCLIADYDCSSHVDMVDFSILMYYWGTSNPTADLNGDHIVDLTDFSIMMFYWNP
jgi:hypothetical protein